MYCTRNPKSFSSVHGSRTRRQHERFCIGFFFFFFTYSVFPVRRLRLRSAVNAENASVLLRDENKKHYRCPATAAGVCVPGGAESERSHRARADGLDDNPVGCSPDNKENYYFLFFFSSSRRNRDALRLVRHHRPRGSDEIAGYISVGTYEIGVEKRSPHKRAHVHVVRRGCWPFIVPNGGREESTFIILYTRTV